MNTVFPPFIKFLLFANVAVFVLENLFLSGLTYGGTRLDLLLMQWFALMPIDSGFLPWQLVSYQFMHGSIGHLFFNMLALWMFGMELENLWGTRRFAMYYVLSGIAAGATHIVVSMLMGGPGAPTVGASGSIMGVLLAFGLTFPTRPVMMFPIFFPIPARIFVLLYAGLDLVMGLMNTNDGVAHFAHLGGALGGWLLLRFGAPLFRLADGRATSMPRGLTDEDAIDVQYRDIPRERVGYNYPSQTATVPPPPVRTSTPTKFVVDGESITQETIDDILDKISQAGYHSLTEHEKRILFEVSRQI